MKPKPNAIWTQLLIVASLLLQLHSARAYYNTELGSWVSRDPIEEAGGLNLYEFVNNDPVNAIDAVGLATVVWNDDPMLSQVERGTNHDNLESALIRSSRVGEVAGTIAGRFERPASSLAGASNTRKCQSAFKALGEGLRHVQQVMSEVEAMKYDTFELYFRGVTPGTVASVQPRYPWRNGFLGNKRISLGRRIVPGDTFLHELAHLTGLVPNDIVPMDAASPREAARSGVFYNKLHDREIARELWHVFTGFPLAKVIGVEWGGDEWRNLENCCRWNERFGNFTR